jgi:hypothetical protein
MKRLALAGVLMGLPLGACYEFDFPLDPKPQVRVDARLIGAWRCLAVSADPDEPSLTLRIEQKSQWITNWWTESRSSDGALEKDGYEAHGSSLKGGALLNVRELGEKADDRWSFVRYTFLLPDVLRLQVVDDEPFAKEKGSANALRRALEKRRNDPVIYGDLCVCVRVETSPGPSPMPSPRL